MTQPLSVATVDTERLTLPLWSAGQVDAIRHGGVPTATGGRERPAAWHPDFPRPDDVAAASLWAEGDLWGPRSIVRGTTVLGSIGFFVPPEDDEVEVGYGLVREAWGWGFATEALRALLAAADAVGGALQVRASVVPENAASLRVLAKCGFTQLRGTTDDGELVMVRPRAV